MPGSIFVGSDKIRECRVVVYKYPNGAYAMGTPFSRVPWPLTERFIDAAAPLTIAYAIRVKPKSNWAKFKRFMAKYGEKV